MTEDEMFGWHHNSMDVSLSKLPEIVKERQVWHAVCSPWDRKESDMTYQLYNNGISIFNILRNFCRVLHSG